MPKTFTEKDEMIWTLTAHGVTEKAWATLRPDYLLDNVVKASETGALGAGTSSPEVRSNQPPTVKVDGAKTLTAKVGQPLTLTAIVKDDGIPKRRRRGNPLAALFGGRRPRQRTGRGRRRWRWLRPGTGGARSFRRPAQSPVGRTRTPQELTAAADALGVSEAQLQLLIAARRNPEMNPPARITVGKTTGLHLSWFVYRGAGKVTFSPEQVKPWEDTRAGHELAVGAAVDSAA